jgi:DNA repair exonuclease SbcCD ATPase subunit
LQKAEFEGKDPERYSQALVAEEKAGAAIAKLRQQLAALEEALQPLQQHLEEAGGPDSGAATAATGSQHQLELEQRLEAVQQQQQQEEQQGEEGRQGGGTAHSDQQQHAATLGAAAHMNGHANGHVGLPLPGAAAVPLRKGLPWQQ